MIQFPPTDLEGLRRLERELMHRIDKSTKTMKTCQLTEELKEVRKQIKALEPTKQELDDI